jgi:hypothetical protein
VLLPTELSSAIAAPLQAFRAYGAGGVPICGLTPLQTGSHPGEGAVIGSEVGQKNPTHAQSHPANRKVSWTV